MSPLPLKVLVADDEPGMRQGVERALRGFTVAAPHGEGAVGFTVAQAENGEEALAMIAADPPDLLLLDHKMPVLSGLEVLARLAEAPRDLLTIMITAYASIETAVTATRQGAYDFLPKPFTPEELRSIVAKAAGHLLVTRQARRLAEEKRQVRFQFISVLGHELKAPLNAVEGYLRVLAQENSPADLSALPQIIARCLDRLAHMRKLIDDLLDMTRLESGRMRRELVRVDLREAAISALEHVQPGAAVRGIRLALRPGPPVPILADRAELEMIFNNLLTNAVKYNRDGGRVDVAIAAAGDRATISVADTGLGMTAAEVGRLFGEFVRIRNERTRHILGSGLGLSIVKRIAQLYEGDVTVTSVPDQGSTFTVTLLRGGIEE